MEYIGFTVFAGYTPKTETMPVVISKHRKKQLFNQFLLLLSLNYYLSSPNDQQQYQIPIKLK